jgi:hypothetical protein
MDLFNNFVSFLAPLANKWEVNEPFTDFKEAYNLVRREVLHCNLIEFGILMKLLRLIPMHLNEICSKVNTHKHFFLNNQPDALIIQIYSVIKLYMFRASSLHISGVFYCTFGTGKFHAGF